MMQLLTEVMKLPLDSLLKLLPTQPNTKKKLPLSKMSRTNFLKMKTWTKILLKVLELKFNKKKINLKMIIRRSMKLPVNSKKHPKMLNLKKLKKTLKKLLMKELLMLRSKSPYKNL